jgi:hypothetical protein
MMNEQLRRWCGYAAVASGVLLLLASLTLVARFWAGDEVALAFSILLILAKFLLVLVLLGVYVSAHLVRSLWLAGFVMALIGTQMDLADFFPPSGAVITLIGLTCMVLSLTSEHARLRLGLWGWIGANVLALGGAALSSGPLLAAAIALAGGVRLWIGMALLPSRPAGPSTMSG